MQAGSIRLRLKQAEVRILAEGNSVVETVETAPVPLTYVLRPDPEIDSLTARFGGATLTISVPARWLTGWDTDGRVGFDGTDGNLGLLIEKDWKCINPAQPEDNEDCFENPSQAC